MTESTENSIDEALKAVLGDMLARDDDITARAAARLHPTLKAASSITRSNSRSALLAQYQRQQEQYRQWSTRAGKRSTVHLVADLAARESRIADLEEHISLLTASHIALIREAGELGGFRKWLELFEKIEKINMP